jgi:hypothetical protein
MILTALVTGLFNKRKLSAEATEVIAKAASGVVERLESENQRILAREAMLIQRDEMTQRHLSRQDTIIAVHAYWDQQAYEALTAQGINLPKPPPLKDLLDPSPPSV